MLTSNTIKAEIFFSQANKLQFEKMIQFKQKNL